MKHTIVKRLSLLLCAVALLLCAMPIFAEGEGSVDPDAVLNPARQGVLAFAMKTAEDTPVPGGQLRVLLVAQALHDPYTGDSLRYVAPFAAMPDAPALDYDAVMENFSHLVGEEETESGNARSAADLWAYVQALEADEENPVQVDYIPVEIGAEGTGSVGLPVLGLYLVAQTQQEAAPGYFAISPFLVTVPLRGEDGKLIYAPVDASPKMQQLVPIPTPAPPPPGFLPQTGLLNWPVPVLAIAGMALFALGFALRRNEKESHRG